MVTVSAGPFGPENIHNFANGFIVSPIFHVLRGMLDARKLERLCCLARETLANFNINLNFPPSDLLFSPLIFFNFVKLIHPSLGYGQKWRELL